MNYQPVRILTLFEVTTNKRTGVTHRTPAYYQVRCKSLGTCGHKHSTEEAAKPCLIKMQQEFTKRRSMATRKQWKERQAWQAALADTHNNVPHKKENEPGYIPMEVKQ